MSSQDPQQKRAYKWEDSLTSWSHGRLDERQMEQVVRKACAKYRIPPPTLRFAKRDRVLGRLQSSTYKHWLHEIRFRPRHMEVSTALHETAHAITDYILGPHLEPHGEQWLGVFMVLLEDYKILPVAALHAQADALKLRYSPRSLVGPDVIRKRNRRRWREAQAERR